MRVKLFTFRFSPMLGAFDDGPLIDFVRDKEVLAFREQFFLVADMPHLASVVTYQEVVVPADALAEARAIATARPSSAATPLPPPSSERDRRSDRNRRGLRRDGGPIRVTFPMITFPGGAAGLR